MGQVGCWAGCLAGRSWEDWEDWGGCQLTSWHRDSPVSTAVMEHCCVRLSLITGEHPRTICLCISAGSCALQMQISLVRNAGAVRFRCQTP